MDAREGGHDNLFVDLSVPSVVARQTLPVMEPVIGKERQTFQADGNLL
jgi:hypothetical protein